MNSNQLEQLQQWLESQKAHWQGLLTGHHSGTANWQTVFDSCSQLAQQQSDDQAELTESMARQVKGFSVYGEQLLRALQQPDSAVDLKDAVEALSDHLHQQASEPFYRHWQLPETMQQPIQQLLQQLGLSPSDFSSFPFLHQGIGEAQTEQRQKLLDAAQALTEFSQALQQYSQLHQQINQHTNQQLIDTLESLPSPPETLAELHSLWIDSYEQSYQQQLSSDRYQQLYGRLCNATVKLQQQLRNYWQQQQRALGLVPYQDYDSLLQQQHQLRKSHKQSLRSIKQQQQQIDMLEQRLQQLERQSARPNADAMDSNA